MEGNTDTEIQKVAKDINSHKPQPQIKTPEVSEIKESIGPRIKYEFFFSPHYVPQDFESLKKNFEEADVYIPEAFGWTSEQFDAVKEVVDGKVQIPQFIDGEDSKPSEYRFALSQLRMLNNSHKPIAFIDVPSEEGITKEPWIDIDELSRKSKFFEALDFVRDSVGNRFSENKDREAYIVSQLKPKIEELLEEYPSLKTKKEIKVLLSLGALHTPIYQATKKEEGDNVTRRFSQSPVVYEFCSEGIRRYQFGKDIDDNLAAKIYLELLFTGAFGHLFDSLTEDYIKSVKLERKIISQFSFDEIKDIFERIKQGKGSWGDVLEAKFKEKGIELPRSEQELDEFLANPDPSNTS